MPGLGMASQCHNHAIGFGRDLAQQVAVLGLRLSSLIAEPVGFAVDPDISRTLYQFKTTAWSYVAIPLTS